MMNVGTALAVPHPESSVLARRFGNKFWKITPMSDVILA